MEWQMAAGIGTLIGIGMELIRTGNKVLKLQEQEINLLKGIYGHVTGIEQDESGEDEKG